jgi:hypothetical protein
VPALFVTLAVPSAAGKLDLAWLIAMTAFTLLLLAMRRDGAAALIAMYAGFVVVQLIAG